MFFDPDRSSPDPAVPFTGNGAGNQYQKSISEIHIRKEKGTHMPINPMQIFKFKEKLNGFKNRHKGFVKFIKAARREGVPEGSVLDIKLTFPDGETMTSNFRITEEDLELIRMLITLKD